MAHQSPLAGLRPSCDPTPRSIPPQMPEIKSMNSNIAAMHAPSPDRTQSQNVAKQIISRRFSLLRLNASVHECNLDVSASQEFVSPATAT